jgi:hypothetical protein
MYVIYDHTNGEFLANERRDLKKLTAPLTQWNYHKERATLMDLRQAIDIFTVLWRASPRDVSKIHLIDTAPFEYRKGRATDNMQMLADWMERAGRRWLMLPGQRRVLLNGLMARAKIQLPFGSTVTVSGDVGPWSVIADTGVRWNCIKVNGYTLPNGLSSGDAVLRFEDITEVYYDFSDDLEARLCCSLFNRELAMGTSNA